MPSFRNLYRFLSLQLCKVVDTMISSTSNFLMTCSHLTDCGEHTQLLGSWFLLHKEV
uniref:Uncharacterized protein n=1 Tax=Picea glauca TaxID=3330 RepID=A0A101M1W5_PICGL|nr:hypothetical protein ABT39_MTgene3953 [Picea glauca]QHR91067.1 hypothetical protein Q903MT_gene5099 [Picea sitchensis]